MQVPTPVFDFNSILTNLFTQAVNQATAPLLARIELLERSLVVADKAAQGNESDLFSRMALLEDKFDNITTASDERIKEIAEEVAEAAIYEHNDEYDHDQYDRFDDRVEEKVTEAIDDYDFESKLNDCLSNASISISI